MNPQGTAPSTTKMPPVPSNTASNSLSMWECLWSTLHRNGWRMSHYTTVDETTGGLRHQVRAHRHGDELICCAPNMTLAMQVIFAESRTLAEA